MPYAPRCRYKLLIQLVVNRLNDKLGLTNGTNPWYVAQQLGHVDVQMVFRIYGKFIPADYRKPTVALKVVVAND